jgi:hypothetical protein
VEGRAALLAKVVRYELPLDETLLMLSAFGWDSDRELYQLSSQDVIALLDRYLEGTLTAAQVQHWAELLELRDDLGYDARQTDLLKQIIYRLANPEVNGAITRGLAVEIQAQLIEEAG